MTRNKNVKPSKKNIKINEKNWNNYYEILKTSWKVQTKAFFENSTLHGVRYIAENGRPFFEKFLWFCCVIIGLVSSIIIIFSLWEKFQTNPTITGLDTDFHNWQVPFPAITICDENPGNQSLIDEFTDNFDNKPEMKEFLEILIKFSYGNMRKIEKYNGINTTFLEKSIKDTIFPLMKKCEEIFENCDWKSKSYTCCDGFFPIFTEIGFCYTFNSRHYERKDPWTDQEYPPFSLQYIKETDLKWSLAFTVKNIESQVPIYILNSDEMAGLDVKPQHLWDFQMKSISFSVKETYTTDDTKQLSIKQRHCIFPDEIKLHTTHIYTYTACARQCRMDNSMKFCNCVPYFYQVDETAKYKHCDFDGLQCVSKFSKKIIDVEKCDCQLGCSNTVYEVEKLNSNDGEPIKSLEIGFMSWPMIRYKREVLFGWVDLLVSFGGIAGLFLGFSLLSGVEIIYYFTIRTYFMVVKQRKKLEKIREEEKLKKPPPYDLSLTPYFKSAPLPGHGINEFKNKFLKNLKHNKKIVKIAPENTIFPPFGIQYLD